MTSLTDTPAYRAICARAARDPETFATFRRHPDYRDVLSVTREQADAYRALTPERFHVETDDPVMARYAFTVSELERLFGQLHQRTILEIGAGFGGLARLILERYAEVNYLLVDLPEVLDLQMAYLERWSAQVRPLTGPLSRYEASPDLLVSCYAYSELNADTQALYALHYLSRCRAGYMVCNAINPHGLSLDGIAALIPGSRWEPEIPLTHPDNRVLVW